MKRYLFLIMILLSTVVLMPCTSQSQDAVPKNVTIFIDISGSMCTVLADVQSYITNEMIPEVPIGARLQIYKFYGRSVLIYDEVVKNYSNIAYAQERVNLLLANGPWTNLKTIFQYIHDVEKSDQDKFIICTDGRQELQDRSDNFIITEKNIHGYLEDSNILQKAGWFVIEYIHTMPIIAQIQPQVSEEKFVAEQKISDIPSVKENSVRKNKKAMNVAIIICIAIITVAVLIYGFGLMSGRAMPFPSLKSIRHSMTGIKFTQKIYKDASGKMTTDFFPRFKSIFTVKLPKHLQQASNYVAQFPECNRQFRSRFNSDVRFRLKIKKVFDEQNKRIAEGKTYKKFSLAERQEILKERTWENFIENINNGNQPSGFVWHHSDKKGIIQLVDEELHRYTSHTGGQKVWGGGSAAR